jgi:hypothetical protein
LSSIKPEEIQLLQGQISERDQTIQQMKEQLSVTKQDMDTLRSEAEKSQQEKESLIVVLKDELEQTKNTLEKTKLVSIKIIFEIGYIDLVNLET